MKNKELITIFTASYNREKLLGRLYESLENQTFKNFEWLIVDDGSTDDTKRYINQIKQIATFPICIETQKNQGKHIAINRGVSLAKGSYFFIVDSDDKLPKNALEILTYKLDKIKNDETLAGVVGLKYLFDKQIVGNHPFDKDTICSVFDYRYKYNAKGDRAEVFKTSILKKFPFPQFKEEKFIPESIVWNRIGQHYKMLFFDKNVYECEYLEDGLSANSINLRRKNPKGILNLYAELGKVKQIGLKNRVKAYANFWRFFFCDINSKTKNLDLISKQYIAYLCFPLGFLLYLKDKL